MQRSAGNAAVARLLAGQRSPLLQRVAAREPGGQPTRTLHQRGPTLQRVYDDNGLRQVDAVAADILLQALKGEGGAAEVYKQALAQPTRFNLIVTADFKKDADYYGYTDVVYRKTDESFLFSAKKFDVMRAVAVGLDLKIVINAPNAATTGQRLSTLVHEFGVHGTRVWSALAEFNKPMDYLVEEKGKQVQKAKLSSEADLKELLMTHLTSHAYDATFHHEELGAHESRDYEELKKNVNQALTEKQSLTTGGFDFLTSPLASVGLGTDWAALQKQFGEATQAGESKHFAMYTHPKLQFEHLLKVAEEVEASVADFNARAKSQSGFLTSISTTASDLGSGIAAWFGGSSEGEKKGKEKKEKEKEHS